MVDSNFLVVIFCNISRDLYRSLTTPGRFSCRIADIMWYEIYRKAYNTSKVIVSFWKPSITSHQWSVVTFRTPKIICLLRQSFSNISNPQVINDVKCHEYIFVYIDSFECHNQFSFGWEFKLHNQYFVSYWGIMSVSEPESNNIRKNKFLYRPTTKSRDTLRMWGDVGSVTHVSVCVRKANLYCFNSKLYGP